MAGSAGDSGLPMPPRLKEDPGKGLSDREYWTPERLEKAFSRVEGKWFGDLRVMRAGRDASGEQLWRVERRGRG